MKHMRIVSCTCIQHIWTYIKYAHTKLLQWTNIRSIEKKLLKLLHTTHPPFTKTRKNIYMTLRLCKQRKTMAQAKSSFFSELNQTQVLMLPFPSVNW